MLGSLSPSLIIAGIILPILGYIVIMETERSKEFMGRRLSSKKLLSIFSHSAKDKQGNFLNKMLLVHGDVKDVETDDDGKTVIILETEEENGRDVRCLVNPSQRSTVSDIKPGSHIELKGMCIGMIYDIVLLNTEIIRQRFLPTFF